MDFHDRTADYGQVRTFRLLLPLLWIAIFVIRPVASAAAHPLLIPEPREYTGRGVVSLRHGIRVLVPGGNSEDRFTADDLRQGLRERGIGVRETARALPVELLRDSSPLARAVLRSEHLSLDTPMQPEGYVLVTRPNQVLLIAHSSAGIFYGAQTLEQMVIPGGEGPVLAGAVIRDWPAMRWRGVHDDLSRGPVPTLAFQEMQIRTFAAYKLNVYSPYFENTMQYASNPLPALPGGSMSAADAKTLVDYARRYHVTIIPEQEAFGHLHHVLTWQEYAPLAEIPNGAVLAPGQPGSMQLITQWFDELAGVYPGPFLHIGADETFELGQGQTADAVHQRGLGAVYISFLTQIHQALAPLHRRLLFWGDMAMRSPSLVPQLPHDMIAVAWEYSPQPEGFERWIAPFTHAGMETWVSPGVNNWNRVWPDFNMALPNIQRFVADGQQAHSAGMLNTIWNDDGEGLFLEDWYAVLFGAQAAWHPGTADVAQFQRAYGAVFHGDSTGKIDEAQRALMDAQQILEQAGLEDARDAYFWMDPWSREGQKVAAKIRPVNAQVRLDAERALTLINQAKQQGPMREEDALDAMELGARRIDFLAFKFQTADQIADAYRRLYDGQKTPAISAHVSRDLWNLSGVDGRCEDLLEGYKYLEARYRDIWLRENRPFWLNVITARYDGASQRWADRAAKLAAAREAWGEHEPLPAPAEIGIAATATP